ncbi:MULTISPECIES: HlyD family secretion protein [unclassified Rhizobium]|uniref:HlyD family secretion protein n=1 Tax=unclassified Rhizobium TaxID=2613769 RepID=UPI0037FD13FC
MARDAATLNDRVQELWNKLRGTDQLRGIATPNGRIEAQQVLVSAKLAGRVADVLVEEGQIVDAGAVIAQMDTSELGAQLLGAEADVRRSETGVATAEATIAQRGNELTLARLGLERASDLSVTGSGTRQQLDLRRSQLAVAEAVSRSALASRDETQAGLDAARAEAARLRSQLDDAILKAPRRGRVEFKLVQSGEVVAAGAPIATLPDLTDVYVTVFLPARAAGRLSGELPGFALL